MPVKIKCSNCGGRYAAPDGLSGKQTTCPACGEKIQVSSSPPTGTDSSGLTQAVYCGGCQVGFSAPQHLWGTSVACPQCGIAIKIPVSPQASPTTPANLDDVFGNATAFLSSAAAQPSPLGSPMTGGVFQRPQAPVQRMRRWNLELSELNVPQILGLYIAFGIVGGIIGLFIGMPIISAGGGMLLFALGLKLVTIFEHDKGRRFGYDKDKGWTGEEFKMLLLSVALGLVAILIGIGGGYLANEMKFEGKYFKERSGNPDRDEMLAAMRHASSGIRQVRLMSIDTARRTMG